MHRLAPLALLTLALAACSDDQPEEVGQVFGETQRTVHDARTKDFVAEDGTTYTLVRVEYGDTPECSDWDDEDCWYSTYCGFIVENVDYPIEVNWVTDADALFDPAEFGCDDIEDCDLPGQELPILDDENFEDWMYETDPEDDVLVDCFADYW